MRAWGGGFWKKYRPAPFTGWDEDKVPDEILVKYDCHETDAQRKERQRLGKPVKTYSFTVERIDDAQQSQHPVSRDQKD